MSTALASVDRAAGHGGVLAVEAQRAARVLMRKSPETQRTYQGIYDRFAAWLAQREGVSAAPVDAFTSEALVLYLDELEARRRRSKRSARRCASSRATCTNSGAWTRP